jgi:hypothetical protein
MTFTPEYERQIREKWGHLLAKNPGRGGHG